MKPDPAEVRAVSLAFDMSKGTPAPLAASFFSFSRLQEEIALMIGYLDIPQIAAQMQNEVAGASKSQLELRAVPTHTFNMSLGSFLVLAKNVDLFREQMTRDGIHLPDIFSPPRAPGAKK